MSTKRTMAMLSLGTLVALGLLCLPSTAAASEHHDDRRDVRRDVRRDDHSSRGGLFIGAGVPARSGGYYVDQVETVLVEPGRYEQRWVPPVYQTTTDRHHRPITVQIRAGYSEQVWVPDRYERRVVRVWVPAPQPTVRFGFGFHF